MLASHRRSKANIRCRAHRLGVGRRPQGGRGLRLPPGPQEKGAQIYFSSFLSCAGDMIAETSFLDIGRNIKTMRPFFDVDVVINDDQCLSFEDHNHDNIILTRRVIASSSAS